MPDGRFLSKSAATSERLADLDSDSHRLLWAMALPHLDRDGRIDGSPRVLRATCVPMLEWSDADVANAIDDMDRVGLVVRYALDGSTVLQFYKFGEHQRGMKYEREAPSKWAPPPDRSGPSPEYSGPSPELLCGGPELEPPLQDSENTQVRTRSGVLRTRSGVVVPRSAQVKLSKVKLSKVKDPPLPPTGGEKRAPKKSTSRGHRLPDDWRPTRDLRDWARETEGLHGDVVDRETDKFRDHWHAASGRNATKLDWDRAWRNWLRNAAERLGRSHRAGGRSSERDWQERKRAERSEEPRDMFSLIGAS